MEGANTAFLQSVHQLPLLLCSYHFCCALLAVVDVDTHFQNGILKVPSGSCVWKQKAHTDNFHPLRAFFGIRQDSSLALLAGGDTARERSSSPAQGWRQPGPPVLFHTECHFSNSWPFTTYWKEELLLRRKKVEGSVHAISLFYKPIALHLAHHLN